MTKHFDAELVNLVYPISSVTEYPNGNWQIKRKSLRKSDAINSQNAPPRGKVKYLSRRSLSRLTFLAKVTSEKWTSMITLTYGLCHPTNGKSIKAQLGAFLKAYRRRRGHFSYLWFLEFQRRGAPHFHVLTSLPLRAVDREFIAQTWVRIALDGDYLKNVSRKTIEEQREKMLKVARHPSTFEEIKSKDGAAKYVTKYAAKPEQKQVPEQFRDVGRFWGSSESLSKLRGETFKATEEGIRAYLKTINHPAHNYEVIPKFLFDTEKKWG